MRTSVGTGSIRLFGPPSKLTWQLSQIRAIVLLIRMAQEIYCIKACLPTLRPVWVAVRRKLFSSQPSNQLVDPPARAASPKRTQAPSWATRILKSNPDDNEYTQPFSTVSSHTEERPHHYSSFDQPRTKTAVAIPLSNLKKQDTNDKDGITVNSDWNVEYNHHSHSNES
jgi:hypothetical protein